MSSGCLSAPAASTTPETQQQQQQQLDAAAAQKEREEKKKRARQVALSRGALNDAHRAFNTAFQGKLDRIQAAQAERFHKIEEPHLRRIGRPNLRYDIGDDLDEITGNTASVLEAKARKITLQALGPFDLAVRNRRLNQEIDAAVQQHILEHSKVDVDRVFSFIGVRQLRQLRIEFCLCAIENERFTAAGGSFDPSSTEEILAAARDKGLIKPDSEIAVGATDEDMTEEERVREDSLLRSMLLEAAEGGLTTPQFVELILRALRHSGSFSAPTGSEEFQELEQGLRNLFSVVDADGSGLASWDEVVEYLNHIAEQKKAAESGQTQVLHSVASVQIKRGPCRKVWTGAERKDAALWAAQVNTTYDSHVFILHPATLAVDSCMALPTQISACTWLHMRRGHKEEFLGLAVADITCHIFFIPCEEASPLVPPKLPATVAECTKIHVGRTCTEILWNADINCLVLCTSDGWVMTYNFWELLELNTMARPKFSYKVATEPIVAAICVRQKLICGTLTGDLAVCSLIAETGVTNPCYSVGQPVKRPGGIRTLHFLPSANLILCGGESPNPTAWLLSRIVQHDPIAVIQDMRPNEKPHETGIISFFSDPVLFHNRFFTIDHHGLCKEWEIGLLQCVGTASILLVPTAKAPFGSTEITAASNVFDLCKFGRMKGLDGQAPIVVEGENIILPPGTPHLALGAFVFMPADHSLTYQRMAFVPIEEMRVKERAKSSSSNIACCQYHAGSDKLVATLGCDMAFWHASTGKVSKIYDHLTHCDISAAFLDASGQRVAYGTSDGRCYLHVLVGGKPPLEFRKACDSEITMAWTDGEMCIFAAKQGKILSYCLTSETRDITEAMCDISFEHTGTEFNVGSVCIVENQCVVGDQFGRVMLFDVVPVAGKILTVLSHRKTLTGQLPPAQAAANAAAQQYAKEMAENDDDGNNSDKVEKSGDDDDDDSIAQSSATGDEKAAKKQHDGDDEAGGAVAAVAGGGMAERVEKHFHAQRGWEANQQAWDQREALQRYTIAQFATAEKKIAHGKLHERLVGLFHLGGSRESAMMQEIQREANEAKKNRSHSNNNNNNNNNNSSWKKRKSMFHRILAEQAREEEQQQRLLEKQKRKRGRSRRSPRHQKEISASKVPGASTLSESIAAVKASSDRLVYSIARPSYGEVIALCPVLGFPLFAVSNACGDIYLTSHSCVEPANVELLRWPGSAPRSVVDSANKSNVTSLACMHHPNSGRLLLVTGDDAGCISMWDLEDSVRFFFNDRTRMRLKRKSSSMLLAASGGGGGSRRGSMLLKQEFQQQADSRRASVAAAAALAANHSITSHPGVGGGGTRLGRRRSTVTLLPAGKADDPIFEADTTGGDDSSDDDDDDDDGEEIVPDEIANDASAMALAAGAKWYLAESEQWLRTPKPHLVACYRVTDGASITAINVVSGPNVGLISTGEGKILAVNLFTVSSRMEAGAILGTYIPHKRFTDKAPGGFKTFRSAAAAAAGGGDVGGSLADVLELSSQRAVTRWKKIQEYVLGKRVAWYHLTDDVVKKAALEDEVSAQTRGSATALSGSPTKTATIGGGGGGKFPFSPSKAGGSPFSASRRAQQKQQHKFAAPAHPDDDVQDDDAWDALIDDLMGNNQEASQSPSGSGIKHKNDNNLSSNINNNNSNRQESEFGTAQFLVTMIGSGDEDSFLKTADEQDDEERRRREQNERVDLRVVRWEHRSPASTPKAKSRKSALGKQQQNFASKKSRNKKGGGATPNNKNNRTREEDDDDGFGAEDGAPPPPPVLEVVRPFQVSAVKMEMKLMETLLASIRDCRAILHEQEAALPASLRRPAAGQDEESFSFVQFMPRPPRLYPPQVSAALTMPCACDVDVLPPPHGVAPEWVKEAIEHFQPFTVVGRLLQQDDLHAESAAAADANKAKTATAEQHFAMEELDEETKKAAMAAALAAAAKIAAIERREYEEQLRRRRKTWGNEMVDRPIKFVFDAIQDPYVVGLPSSEHYRSEKQKALMPKQKQQRPGSAGLLSSTPSPAGSARGRRPPSSPRRENNNNNNNSSASGDDQKTPPFRALTPMLGTKEGASQARPRERGERPQVNLFGGLGPWKDTERRRQEHLHRKLPSSTAQFQELIELSATAGWPLVEHPLLAQPQDNHNSAGAALLTLSLKKRGEDGSAKGPSRKSLDDDENSTQQDAAQKFSAVASKNPQHRQQQPPLRHLSDTATALPDGTRARLQPVFVTDGPSQDFGKQAPDAKHVYGRFSPLVGSAKLWGAGTRSDRTAEFSKLLARSSSANAETAATPANQQREHQQQQRTPSMVLKFETPIGPSPFRINEHDVDQKRFILVEDMAQQRSQDVVVNSCTLRRPQPSPLQLAQQAVHSSKKPALMQGSLSLKERKARVQLAFGAQQHGAASKEADLHDFKLCGTKK